MSWETYRQALREMVEACELVRFNCELAQSFAEDAVKYSAMVVANAKELEIATNNRYKAR